MSKRLNNPREFFQTLGGKLQRSPFVSLLMILMVFAAGVALLWMPSQSDLPSLVEGAQSAQDIEAVCDFSYLNRKEAQRVFQTFALEFPRYFRLDPERSEHIKAGYDLLIREVLRRNAAEEERKIYSAPENAEPEVVEMVSFVREIPSLLYFFLRQTALDDVRKTKAAAQVEEIVLSGIATADELKRAQPFTGNLAEGDGARAVNAQMNAKILDSDLREVGPIKISDLQTPELAADQTVNSLLSAVSYDQRVPYEDMLRKFFRGLYAKGNLSYDEALTK